MRRLILFTCYLSLGHLLLAVEDRPHPNILLVLADDLGYGDVGCYNPESKIPTPHLDKLATEGIRFTDAHSPSTVCTPTRYSVLTGRMAFRTGLRGVFTGAGEPNLIEAGRLTLPGMLKQHGYTTAMFGKWHVGLTFLDKDGNPINQNGLEAVRRIDFNRPIPDSPIHRGFDHFRGTACCPTTDWLYAFIDGDRIPVPPTRQIDKSDLPKHSYANDCRPGLIAPDFDMQEIDNLFLQDSLTFLKNHAGKSPDKPFFLFHSTQAAHLPSFAGKDFRGKTGAGPHGDFIFQLDHIVGQLLAALDQHSFADNTLVIFTSDNGPEIAPVIHMRKDHDHDPSRPWRGMKRDQWEAGHRVPFIARWPGKIKPATTSDQTTNLCDLIATTASIVGHDLPDNAAEDAYDILPALLGTATEPIREFTITQTWSNALAIRHGHWKYLDHQGSGGNNYTREKLRPFVLPEKAPGAPGQLYNLISDPGETTNLYHDHPEIVAKLKAQLDTFVSSGRSR